MRVGGQAGNALGVLGGRFGGLVLPGPCQCA
jgi:hypothetical protein